MSTYVFARKFDLGSSKPGVGGLIPGIISVTENVDLYSIVDRVHRLDSEIFVLDQTIEADMKQMVDKLKKAGWWKFEPSSGTSTSKLLTDYVDEVLAEASGGTPGTPSKVDPLTKDERIRAAWLPNWTNYKLDWSAFKAKGIASNPLSSVEMRTYELRYLQLRETWEKLPGAPKPATPVAPLPKEPSLIPDIPWKWIGGAVVVVAIGYVLLVTQPMWMPAIAGAFSTRRATA